MNSLETGRVSDSHDHGGLMVGGDSSMNCRECGKSFQSWKALYGHMRCHPKPERVFNSIDNDDSWVNGERQKLLTKTQTEDVRTPLPLYPKKSKKMRYSETTPTASYSSSVMEIDEERKQAAINLMYLSRDVWNYVDPRSSHSNFVDFETHARLPCVVKRNPRKSDVGFDLEWDATLKSSFKIKKLKKLKSVVSESEFLRDEEPKKKKLKKKLVDRSGYAKPNKGNHKRSKLDYSEADLGKQSIVKAKTDRADSDFGYALDFENRNRFECRICNKTFLSHQALGGHMSSHKNINVCISTENFIDEIGDSKLHKSSSNEFHAEESQTEDLDIVAETANGLSNQIEFPEIRLFDLNLPFSTEEETQMDFD